MQEIDVISFHQVGPGHMFSRLAVYGTLRQGFGNHRLLSKSHYVGTYRINGLSMYASGIPYTVVDPDGSVVVEVYDVDPAACGALDNLEGHPDWYVRTIINTKELGAVHIYLVDMDIASRGSYVPTGDYVDSIPEYRRVAYANAS